MNYKHIVFLCIVLNLSQTLARQPIKLDDADLKENLKSSSIIDSKADGNSPLFSYSIKQREGLLYLPIPFGFQLYLDQEQTGNFLIARQLMPAKLSSVFLLDQPKNI